MRENATDGFPTDYLLARIRGRQTALISDWQSLIEERLAPEASDERIWEALLRELEWLHAQMNHRLRDMFAPLFALFEIKTIVLCLRNKAIRRTTEIERLLERSLLADRLKEILLRGTDVRSTIAALVDAMAGTSEAFRELESVYAEGNLQGFENGLMRVYLQEVAAKHLDPAMKMFFVLFTDLRNVMLLYKHLRWGVDGPCLFIRGGTVEPSRLLAILARRDTAALDDLVRGVTGLETMSVAASEGALETVLLRSITRRLAKLRHTTEGVGLIVVYVWRIYVQARNLAVLHHATDLDPQTLERELIL